MINFSRSYLTILYSIYFTVLGVMCLELVIYILLCIIYSYLILYSLVLITVAIHLVVNTTTQSFKFMLKVRKIEKKNTHPTGR